MSRITDLIGQMSIIPDKEKKAAQLADMIAIRDNLQTAASSATSLRSSALALRLIDGTTFVDKAEENLASAATTAANLKARIETGGGFDRAKADTAVTLINERLANASSGLTRGWRGLVEGRAKRFSPIADAALSASLPGAKPLANSIDTLQTWKDTPPPDAQAAAAFMETDVSLPSAVAELGLEGRAGQFLVDAANNAAKAKDLQDPDVLAFLESNPTIWSMLKVGL